MALVIADRVRETTYSAGTGTITLTGAFSGFQPFSVIGTGNTTYYAILDTTGSAWEVGIGTYTTLGNTLSRDTVLSSSNSGARVPFAIGLKDVICTQPSERNVYVVGSDVVAENSAKVPNSLLANNAITINGNSVALGGSTTVTAATTNALTLGNYLSGTSFNGSAAVTTDVNATSANTANAIVARDASGNFSVGGVTATRFSGPLTGAVGDITPAAGAFTTLSASTTVSGTGFSTYLASPPSIGSTAAGTGAFTTLAASGAVTLSGGTANGVPYLNGSKVLTSGSSLVFDGSNLGLGVTPRAWSGTQKAIQIGTSALSAYTNAPQYVYLSTNWVNNSGDKYIATGAAAVYAQDTGKHIWYTAPSGTAGNAITFTQALAVGHGTSLALANATPQAGTGITFPSDQSASSNANTLNDYEEGTFTLGISTAGGSITLGNNQCGYKKIGNTVFITGYITCSARSSPSGSSQFTGLPYAASGSGTSNWGGNIVNDNLAGKTKMYVPANGAVRIDYSYYNDATVSQDITTSWSMIFNLYYTTAN